MKILSLFDGLSIAQQAFKELGIEVEYYSSEIDKYVIQITQKNFPKTIQLGDIKEIDCTNGLLHYGRGRLAETDIDFIIGGSPCQDLSIAKKNRKGLDGKRSGLFWDYVRILKDLKPKYFILENVNSMPKEAKNTITETLWGIEPVMINAALVSAQNRKRLFWVGKLVGEQYHKVEIPQPEDRGILLKDILEDGIGVEVKNQGKTYGKELDKSLTIMAKDYKGFGNQAMTGSIRIGQIGKGGQGDRIYSPEGKSTALSANGGGRGAKTGLYLIQGAARRTRNGGKKTELNGQEKANAMTSVQTDSLVSIKDYVRKLTCVETERLQSLPYNFSEKGINEKGEEVIISNTQRYKALGNGFCCAVIKHILESIL